MAYIYELSWQKQDGKNHYKTAIDLPAKEALLKYISKHFGDFYSRETYLRNHLYVSDLKSDEWMFTYDDVYRHEYKVITATERKMKP